MKKKSFKGISTVTLHTASTENDNFSHTTPIYATSTFTFGSTDEGMERFKSADKTRIYTRWGNPTFTAAEETIAALESFGLKDEKGEPLALKALLHASGQAAMTTLFLSTLSAGDTLLSHYSLYGGTQELMQKLLLEAGIKCILIDVRDSALLEKTIQENSNIKLIHLETPANPTLQCVDIKAISTIAHQHGIRVSVDNTVATPYLQQPFALGADFVFHSATKFLNGHGSALHGVLLGKDLEFMNSKVWKWHALLGGNSNAFDAYLLIQGMKTLEIRMDRHCSNTKKVAEFLNTHPAVEKVNYTGLKSHPDHAIACKQMKNHAPLMSFELKGGLDAGKKFIDALEVCTRAVSLGTVDTLVSHPASMTHYGIPHAERIKYGITDGLIRMSVGIENYEDLEADLAQALSKI
ncbi:MAG: aminotransferase class I/II-fold pyridoxal phosphate-dependent enzyme [Chitinophagaceae bacterium]|jgi:methionine-gamma-lyase|nr:MAG: aminotransferase class I/II-fold pyridoxal phosphate-dependent enzyme [Chitinophagaceae bacterium]